MRATETEGLRMQNDLIVAVAQICARQDIEENLARCEALVERAARRGAALVVLPENFAYIGTLSKKVEHSERLDTKQTSPVLSRISALSRRLGIHILAGGVPIICEDDARRFYNTSVLLDPSGEIIGSYRKIHLFDIQIPDGPQFVESDYVAPGDEAVAVHFTPPGHEGLKLGLSICYDLRFPELYRALAAQGAQIVTVPAAFTLHTGKDHWMPLLRARAIENQVFVVAADQWGSHSKSRSSYGKSCIIDPWGAVLAQAPDDDAIAVATLDLGYQQRVRQSLPCLGHIVRRDWSEQ